MDIPAEKVSGRRRTGEAVGRLVKAFEASGLPAAEFCRRHGLASSTLRRRLKKRRRAEGSAGVRLVAVKVTEAPPVPNAAGALALEVLLAGGRRIGVGPEFDARTLSRLVQVLEGG